MARTPKTKRPTELSEATSIVHVDSAEFRKKTHTALKRARTAYRKAEEEWTFFHDTEEPAFARWIRVQCASLFSRAHALEQEVQAQVELIEELRYEQVMTGDTPAECYERVMDRREHPEKYPEPELNEEAHAFDEDPDPPDELDFDATPDVNRTESGDALCKRLYRELCRRLHPDSAGEMSTEEQSLWHQTQEAYSRRDPALLELLLTHCETMGGVAARENTLWSIKQVTQQIRHALKTLRRTIREARNHMAWGFLSWDDRYKRKVLRKAHVDLRQRIRDMQFELEFCKAELQAWKRPSWRREGWSPDEEDEEEGVEDGLDDAPTARNRSSYS